jgi:hypothetical protein
MGRGASGSWHRRPSGPNNRLQIKTLDGISGGSRGRPPRHLLAPRLLIRPVAISNADARLMSEAKGTISSGNRLVMLTDAELILGLSRHLGAYAVGPAKAAFAQLEFAGHVFEMAWRLQGSGLSSGRRVSAIAMEAGIGERMLQHEVLPALASLGGLTSGATPMEDCMR